MINDLTQFSQFTERSVPDRFDRVAREHADVTAIITPDGVLTYRELAALTSRVAHRLLEIGIRPGDRVALLFDRTPDAFAAFLGALKSGAVVVPLVPAHPGERLRHIVRDAGPSALVSNGRHGTAALGLADSQFPVVMTEELDEAPAREWPALERSTTALLLYTSGSTGEPKGVLRTHGSVLHRVSQTAHIYAVAPGDPATMFSTYAVGQGVGMLTISLLSGGTLCPFDVRREGLARMADWLARERIAIYSSSATLFRSLTRSLDGSRPFPHLRIARIGGERVTPLDVAEHWRVFPNAALLIGYSATEAGALTTMLLTDRTVTFPGGIVPVGRPLGGTTIVVVDSQGREVPCGEPGEIAVRSAYLASGYWRAPERTAAAFADVPGSPGEREYRTGDLGRMRPDGLLEHLGREDFQVKIRGFRVEIEEIEARLNEHPDVCRAAVAARPDEGGDVRLVAYVQPQPDAHPTVEALRAYLATRLPEHAIPTAFVILDTLPLTDSGKPDRPKLPDPTSERPSLASALIQPRTSLEAAIATIWRQVLHLDDVGVHDAFLSVGGDSLKATQVASRLASVLGAELPLWELFEADTIADIAAVVERHVSADDRSRAIGQSMPDQGS